jgi:23S rRNA (uracil1939-C5)-methyltransferase
MPVITIEKIIYPGRSLGHADGIVVLTDEGLPGERVEVETISAHPRRIEGRTVRIIEPSPRRVPARCAHHRACAPYQVIEYGYQLDIKTAQMREILDREGTAGMPPLELVPSPAVWNYRNRVRFHVLWTPRGGRPAYCVPGSRDEFIAVERCHLAAEPLQTIITGALRAFPRPVPSLREIEARVSAASGETLLVFHWDAPPAPTALDPVLPVLLEGDRPAGILNAWTKKGKGGEALVWGREWITDRIGEASFRIGAGSFFQVNTSILPAVTEVMASVLLRAGVRRLADIYAGLGALGLVLAPLVEAVFAVESEPGNIRFLKTNVELNQPAPVTICDGPAEEWMDWVLDRGVDAVIVDPPRKGLDPALIRSLKRRPAAVVLYLSCNPATLARDIERLGGTYRTTLIKGFDFFPQTPHLETLVVMEKT